MKHLITFFAVSFFSSFLFAQETQQIVGTLMDDVNEAVIFSNVALYQQDTSILVKVESSNEQGQFKMVGIPAGTYRLKASYVGFDDLIKENIQLKTGQKLDLGILSFGKTTVELETATITAQRSILEVKADRTIFNVQGTINSAGDNGLSLLRKAPGVLVDNNNNISVLSRSGVLIYVDGKRLPLSGDDLSNFLQNLTAEQIDRIEIITNPGAKYEAQGNAGIIDIRLKKDQSIGSNGTISGNISKGIATRGNVSASGNYRNKSVNVFGSAGYTNGARYNNMKFDNYQNGLLVTESNEMRHSGDNINFRAGADYFINKKNTLGFLVNQNFNTTIGESDNLSYISNASAPNDIDSVLVANNNSDQTGTQSTYNINYMFNTEKQSVNIDLDYGRFRNEQDFYQPNMYYSEDLTNLYSEIITSYDTKIDIDIYTFKLDYETGLLGGKMGLGTKLSKVATNNYFKFYDIEDDQETFNEGRSNDFFYDENVYAGYLSYRRPINEKINLSAGLRAEVTDAMGDLNAYRPDLEEEPIFLDYVKWFPSFGLSYQLSQMHTLSFNYGKRINRPDYNVLNPFNVQMSELSYSKGNPRLSPEIVQNFELGYTAFYRYNFKLAYSKTFDQITRLISPDDEDPRAGYITWANLAEQTIYSANASLPIQITKWWNGYFNVTGAYQDNQADYGDGATVDLQTFTYNIYQQQTFDLFKGIKGEVSGWFNGPGIWGGVFLFDTSWALNLGLQKKFINDKMNVRLAAQDIFNQAYWSGTSSFNGLEGTGEGYWDSRRVTLSMSYDLGSNKIKSARKRSTGIEDESSRVGGDSGGRGQ